jgi:predicted permease
MIKDFRYAIRVLVRSPLFTGVTALSLALGIGGAVSVFTVLNAVVLRSLPIPDPQQLYVAEKHLAQVVSPRYSWPLFEQARNETAGRAELFAATSPNGMQVRVPGETDAATFDRGLVQLVSGEFFRVLRQHPLKGRLIEPPDNESGTGRPVAVISDGYWERRFRREPDIVGRQLIVGGAALTIIGVAQPDFFGPFLSVRNPDVWVPLLAQPEVRYASNASTSGEADGRKPWPPQPDIEWLYVFARVPKPADVGTVATALTLMHQRDASARVDPTDPDRGERVESETVVLESAARGVSSMRTQVSSALFVLLAMVGVLLAITCGNVASLLLARSSARDREIAIRGAMGASRWRITRQLLAETVILAGVGGGLGVLLAAWGRDGLLAMFSRGAPMIDLEAGFDWRVFGFTVAITVGSGIAVGLVPALRSTRTAPIEALKAQGRQVIGASSRRGALIGKTLVAAQIAFSLLLLVMAALFVRSMQSLLRTDVGFDRERVLVARLDVRSLGYSNDERQALYTRVLERLRSVPGVASVSLSLNGPLSNSARASSLAVERHQASPDERLVTNEEIITEAYFETVGLRILQGRGFAAGDRHPGSSASIINQSMARKFFPAGDAIGKRWSYGDPIDKDSPVIVGVVQDARYLNIRHQVPNMIYRLSSAVPDEVLADLEVRTVAAPAQLVDTVRQVLAQSEPALPVFDVVSLEDRVYRGLSNDRFVANLTSAFGTVALLLACLGLYGTISYGVARRVTELGVRMALGADRANVLWLVVREALVLVLIGGAVGIPLTFIAGRSVASFLYEIGPIDPAAYAVSAGLLLLVASLAAYIPAHRASRIDPMVALRGE